MDEESSRHARYREEEDGQIVGCLALATVEFFNCATENAEGGFKTRFVEIKFALMVSRRSVGADNEEFVLAAVSLNASSQKREVF